MDIMKQYVRILIIDFDIYLRLIYVKVEKTC